MWQGDHSVNLVYNMTGYLSMDSAFAGDMLPGAAGQDVQEAIFGAVVRREHCPVDASADQNAGRLRQLRRPGRMAAVGMNAEPRS